jgi:hypothetical protein
MSRLNIPVLAKTVHNYVRAVEQGWQTFAYGTDTDQEYIQREVWLQTGVMLPRWKDIEEKERERFK